MSSLRQLWTLISIIALLAATISGFPIPQSPTQKGEVETAGVRMTVRPDGHFEERGLPVVHRKRAYLVGISKYHRARGVSWLDLFGVTNDLEAISRVLIERFQFKLEDIEIISDLPIHVGGKIIPPVKPTHKRIVDSFRTFLIEQARPGDVVFFYFAGHGSQEPDDGSDELDGLDETLVPLDYASKTDPSNDIRDDEIGILLGELSSKNPSNITIAFDSCWSGTATRGEHDVIRGGPWQGTPVPKEKIRGDDDTIADWSAQHAATGRPPLKNYVFFSASSSRQLAVEADFCVAPRDCKKYGVFTHALAGAFAAASPTTTYRDIYERVLSEVSLSREQRPQIEGDQRDRVVFEDGALPPESYIRVTAEALKTNPAGLADYHLTLAAGSLQGMTPGSRFALYPPSTKSRNEGKPLAEATVTSVQATEATLTLEGNVSLTNVARVARASEITHNYENVLKVALEEPANFANLKPVLTSLGLVSTVSESSPGWNVLIRSAVQTDRDEGIVPPAFQGFILQRRDGRSIIARIENDELMAERIKEALISEAKRTALISLKNTDPNIRVELRLVPVEVQWHVNSGGRSQIDRVIGDRQEGLKYSESGSIQFRINDWYRVEVRNLSKIDVYITILNLDANGKISPAFPRFDNNNLLKTGGAGNSARWIPIEKLYTRISEPLGLESMRLIATDKQTDFSPLFDPGIIARGKARGGSFADQLAGEVEAIRLNRERGGVDAAQKLEAAMKSPLGRIFIASQEGRGIRGAAAAMPTPAWSTASVSYLVVK